ncbi:MAG TPA: Asd/ArgC dimerization domain-containing protein [Candidatus Polarisedimenticolia bacterium]|nr:Asd/ArgC dimerization domain-containing protein [Candidatus Polarisedimenticolia bacterium]
MARPSAESKPTRTLNLALFDSSTLVGKGVKGQLARRRFPMGRVTVFDTGAMEEGGNVTEFDGEAMLATRPDFAAMESIHLAFFCGPDGSAGEYLDWPRRGGFVAIDLTLTTNRRKGIPVVNAGVNPLAVKRHEGLVASPHPASLILSTLLAPLARLSALREVASVIFQPASEKGEEGIDELYRQTVGVLNFTEFPKERFGGIQAFNLLRSRQSESPAFPDELLAQEVGFILGGARFPHAVATLSVPVFHGHSFLCRVSFAESVSSEALHRALTGQEGLRRLDSGSASPAEMAGQEGIVIGEIRPDPSLPGAFWVWGVSDNLVSGTALNAVRVAEALYEQGALSARDAS